MANAQLSANQIAQIQAQIASLLLQLRTLQGQTGIACTFTRDLAIGSQGADVTCLQTQLAAKGYFNVAPTGYFGGLTQAAVARWQAANAITPAAGYFGAHSRAKFVLTVPVTPPPTDNDDDEDLEGEEAELSGYEFNSERRSGDEGDEEVAVATAEFDVDGGDVDVERLVLDVVATEGGAQQEPWEYFDRVILSMDGEEVAEMDVGDDSDWDETDSDEYQLTISDIDGNVNEGDRGELTIAFDIANTIDTDDMDQEFEFSIDDRGIRVVDAEGIQHYTGDNDEVVTFGFGESSDDEDDEGSGDLSLESSNDDDDEDGVLVVDEDNESDEYTVLRFEIENEEDVETIITGLTVNVDTGSGDADDLLANAETVSEMF